MTFLTYQLYDSKYPYCGILNFIKAYTKKSDIHSSGDINIVVSSNYSSSYDMRNPIGVQNEDHSKYWASQLISNSWYEINFKKYSIRLESYIYQANENDFLERWEILGSNDGYNYDQICQYIRDSAPSGSRKHMECSSPIEYSIIRLLGHGNRILDSEPCLGIYGIEFFGYLYEGVRDVATYKPKCISFYTILSLLFISLIYS